MGAEHEENANELSNGNNDKSLKTNTHAKETMGGDVLNETAVHSPQSTIDPKKKSFGSPIPAAFTNFPISPYPQTPGRPPHFSPIPSSWPLPPPPGASHHHLYAHYPPPSDYHPPYGEYPPYGVYPRPSHVMSRYPNIPEEMEKGNGSGDPAESSAATEKEGPHSHYPYPPHHGYYPPFLYHHHVPHYTHPPASPVAPTPSPFSSCPRQYHHHEAPPPDAYSYWPSKETPEHERPTHFNQTPSKEYPNSDDLKRERLKMTNAPTSESSIESTSMSVYVRPSNISDEAKIRRARINALSQRRAQRKRKEIGLIRSKPEQERTIEESRVLHEFDDLRDRKNDRSKERSIETKRKMDILLQKPEEERTAREVHFLTTHLQKRSRKNEGDRMRRGRMKALGMNPNKKQGTRMRVTARGELPVDLTAGHSALASHQPYANPPPFYGYPPPPFAPAAGGTSFIIANGKASTGPSL